MDDTHSQQFWARWIGHGMISSPVPASCRTFFWLTVSQVIIFFLINKTAFF